MKNSEEKKWDTPVEVSDVDLAFGAGVIGKFMPEWPEIPKRLKSRTNANGIVSTWFFNGLDPKTVFHTKEGIDFKMAIRQIRACMRSFDPKHEHKEAGVAFLLEQFFDGVTTVDGERIEFGE